MSKGLEAFEDIKTVMTKLFGGVERSDKALNTIEKELKALEIIKVFCKGRFELHERKYVEDEYGNYGCVHFISFDDKNAHIRYPISQEKYDLLKEVFYEL